MTSETENELHSLCVELVDKLSEILEQFAWDPPILPSIRLKEDKELLERARKVLESYDKSPELPPALAEAWGLHEENVVHPGDIPQSLDLGPAKASLRNTDNLMFAFDWSDTSQGVDFWSEEHLRSSELSESARQILQH